MDLNTLKPDVGAKKEARRLGRGFTRGKTCGRGHKGQKSRSGASIPAGFEGGQMPLQRRLPKEGFNARVNNNHDEVKLYALDNIINKLKLKKANVDLDFLREHKLISKKATSAKIILSGALSAAVTVCSCTKQGDKYSKDMLRVTSGAKAVIEKAGGKIIPTQLQQSKTEELEASG